MKKLTERKIKRLLSAGGAPEPPAGLAERIKAEIPEALQIGGVDTRPGSLNVPRPHARTLRPAWLLAACLLVMAGAGFVAVRILAPRSDLAREIALGGVVRINDIVVTVPERSTVGKKQSTADAGVLDHSSAPAAPGPPKASAKGSSRRKTSEGTAQVTAIRPAGSLAVTVTDGKEPLPGVMITATRSGVSGVPSTTAVSGPDGHAELRQLAPGEYRVQSELQGFEPSVTTVRVAGDVEDRVGLALKPERLAEEVSVTGSPEPRASAGVVSASANLAFQAASAPLTAKGSILVTVHDANGKPIEGATVMLAYSDRPDVGCGFRVTGRTGVATFCCLLPHTYRMCAQLRGFMPAAKDGIEVPSGRQIDVELTMVRPPADGKAHPWTCAPRAPTERH